MGDFEKGRRSDVLGLTDEVLRPMHRNWFSRSPRLLISFASFFLSDYLVLILVIAYVAVMSWWEPEFSSPQNIRNILSNLLPLLVVALGQTIVLISGGIDLSVTSIIALASITGGYVMNARTGLLAESALAVPAGILAMLTVGSAVGLFNGAAVSRLKMPPFMVTLTSMMFFSGLAIWLTRSQNIYDLPASFRTLGHGGVMGVPYALVISSGVAIVVHLLLSKTLWGRRLYAVGHNDRTALISGVPVTRTLVWAYVASGLCAAVGSILYTARLETGSPVLGQRMLLDVIGAVVLGGTSLFGGKGKVVWTLIGVAFITTIDNSLNMRGLSYFAIMIAKGVVILLAALIDAGRHRLMAAA